MNERIAPKLRETQIIDAAIRLAKKVGFNKITRDAIAIEAGCASGLVSFRLGSMPEIRRAVMAAAIKGRHLEIIAQGIAMNDPQAKKVPPDVRMQAAQLMARS